MLMGTSDHFDANALEASIYSPIGMKRVRVQGAVEAEQVKIAKLQQQVKSRIAVLEKLNDPRKAKRLEKLKEALDYSVKGDQYGAKDKGWISAMGKYLVEFTRGMGLAALSTTALHGGTTETVLTFVNIGKNLANGRSAYAGTTFDDGSGGVSATENALLTAGLTSVAARFANRQVARRAAGTEFGFGKTLRESSRYTDTAKFQTTQFAINAAAGLITDMAFDLTTGDGMAHLNLMQQNAGQEAIRLGYFHMARHR